MKALNRGPFLFFNRQLSESAAIAVMELPLEILFPLLPAHKGGDYVEPGKTAGALGSLGVWAPETAGPDGVSVLAALAVYASSIQIGSGMLPVFLRSLALNRQAIRDSGFAAAVQQLEEAGDHGDRSGARDAFPDELIEQMVRFGPRKQVQPGLGHFGAAGAERTCSCRCASRDGLAACSRTIQALSLQALLGAE